MHKLFVIPMKIFDLQKVKIDDLEKIYPKASKLYSEDSDFNLKAQNKQLNEKRSFN